MSKLSTFNKVFILFRILLIAFIIGTVPHETDSKENTTEYSDGFEFPN